jgi:SPP1 gp7 family putative phage head morphogenesis protein
MEIPKYKARKVFREPTRTAKLKRWYQGQLFKVTDVIGDIVDDIASRYEPLIAAGKIEAVLTEYSASLSDWAISTAGRMVTEASNADYAVWLSVGKKISKATRQLLKESGKGDVFNKLQNEQVTLIKSLPLEASEKVHEWVKEGLSKGDRYDDITKRISVELKPLVKHRAECIARTETARARSNFTQARAKNIGSPGYIWKTVGDSRVRPMHAELNGKFIPWESPPVTDFGRGGTPIHAHAGCVFNCRCWASPIFPDEIKNK